MQYDIQWDLYWGGMHFGIFEEMGNVSSARCTCGTGDGLSRLAILDSLDMLTAVSDFLMDNHSKKQFWVDATRLSGKAFERRLSVRLCVCVRVYVRVCVSVRVYAREHPVRARAIG